MKTVVKSFTILGMLASVVIYAEGGHHCLERENPNHFYFGPEFVGLSLNTHVQDIKVDGTRFFWGLGLGYEYLKPDAVYFGIDILAISSEVDFNASSHDHSLSWHEADKGFGNLEVRLGLTLAPMDWMVTPFLGTGIYDIYALDHHNKEGFKEDLPYVTGGLNSRYAFNCTFELGLNLKVLRTFSAKQTFRYSAGTFTTHNNTWGGEIGVPFDWHIGCSKKWDIQLEPYFLTLNFSGTQNVYGTRLLFGYRF